MLKILILFDNYSYVKRKSKRKERGKRDKDRSHLVLSKILNLPYSHCTSFKGNYHFLKFNVLNSFPLSSSTLSLSHFLKEMNFWI